MQPLLSAMKREAQQQHCDLHGQYDGRELVLIVRPQIDEDEPSPQMELCPDLLHVGAAAVSTTVTFTGPGVEVLAALEDPRSVIVSLNRYRAARQRVLQAGSARQ